MTCRAAWLKAVLCAAECKFIHTEPALVMDQTHLSFALPLSLGAFAPLLFFSSRHRIAVYCRCHPAPPPSPAMNPQQYGRCSSAPGWTERGNGRGGSGVEEEGGWWEGWWGWAGGEEAGEGGASSIHGD